MRAEGTGTANAARALGGGPASTVRATQEAERQYASGAPHAPCTSLPARAAQSLPVSASPSTYTPHNLVASFRTL